MELELCPEILAHWWSLNIAQGNSALSVKVIFSKLLTLQGQG